MIVHLGCYNDRTKLSSRNARKIQASQIMQKLRELRSLQTSFTEDDQGSTISVSKRQFLNARIRPTQRTDAQNRNKKEPNLYFPFLEGVNCK